VLGAFEIVDQRSESDSVDDARLDGGVCQCSDSVDQSGLDGGVKCSGSVDQSWLDCGVCKCSGSVSVDHSGFGGRASGSTSIDSRPGSDVCDSIDPCSELNSELNSEPKSEPDSEPDSSNGCTNNLAMSNHPLNSSIRFPNTVITSLGTCTTSTHAGRFSCTSTGAARARLVAERIRRIRESMLYRCMFVVLWDVDVSRGLDNIVGRAVYTGSAWAFSFQNKSEERHTHYPVSSNVKTSKVSKGAKKNVKQLTCFYI